jgi:tetratricopeptide (TPR) repeat protein
VATRILLLLALASASSACSISRLATGALADSLAESGSVYMSDEDPELVEEAIPFGLKTMESVLAEHPEHHGLLVALASGFTSYAYGFVEMDAFALEPVDVDASEALLNRAAKLYFRARDYGMRALAVEVDDFETRLREAPEATLAELEVEHIEALYWTAAAWGLGIAAAGLDPELVADFPLVEAMAARALELDEDWDRGALHDFFVVLESESPGGSLDEAEEHFERALELNDGHRAGTYVSMAENVCVRRQNGEKFVELLNNALAVDVDVLPEERVVNIINQRRAKLLLERSGDLFIDDPLTDEEDAALRPSAAERDLANAARREPPATPRNDRSS